MSGPNRRLPLLPRRVAGLEKAIGFRPSRGRVERALDVVAAIDSPDTGSLLRLHEALLFLRAYPQTPGVLDRAQRLLSGIERQIRKLNSDGADISSLEDPEVSGIAGTAVTTQFTYDLVRWLTAKFPGDVSISWDGEEGNDRLGSTWPRWVPLLEEESCADANVPYRRWLRSARGREEDLPWLLRRFAALPVTDKEKAELYDALGLFVAWRPAAAASRTRLSRPAGNPYFHDEPLLARRDVSLGDEIAGPPLAVRRLSVREGLRVLDMARAADASRYRELYGFTYGDPRSVIAARAGRGVEILLNGLPPQRRLPLRAGFSAFVLKNGLPVAYVEGLAFFERIEVGFNVYYTFREGESAWIYARVLKLFHQVLGSASFSVDPYQLGHENEEGIESGAFWFYRKLGFRSTSGQLRALTEAEEARLAADRSYRTSARTLRRLATRNVLYEIGKRAPSWDRFHIRNLGLAVNRRMARDFRGDAEAIRAASAAGVARVLNVSRAPWRKAQPSAFENLALVLDLIPDLSRWTDEEKRDLAEVIRAKGGLDESRYLRRMQRHGRLRRALLELGSTSPARLAHVARAARL